MTAARLTVDVGALRTNYRRVLAATARNGNPPLAAVVKANAYGLGALAVANALNAEGCRDYFVANLAEGLALREADFSPASRVHVFSGPLHDDEAAAMAHHDLIPVLNDERQVARWRPYGHRPAAVHVDTGMHRLGFPSEDVHPGLFAGCEICVVLSHFANADDPQDPMNARQVERFHAVARMFPNARPSLGNSAAALAHGGFGMARVGIGLYGGNPFRDRPNPLSPVATLEARVVGLRTVPAGQPVGYGGAQVTERRSRLAVVGIGYADGFSRRMVDGEVAFRGTRLPLFGNVSMDLAQADATDCPCDIALGDWMEVFGSVIALDEFAARAGTIAYEALTSIGGRVERRYVDGNA